MYINIDKINIHQMSLDFNISQKNILKSLQNYNARYGYKHTYKEQNLSNIPEEHKNRFFYHFTHIENLDSILKNGFLSTNEKNRLVINHTDIANESIQDRRSKMTVTCSPNGKVHDYVPFYFTTTNPMLIGLVNRKNIDQPLMIFFVISIEKVLEENVIFTDASANTSNSPHFYNNPSDLAKLDWEAIDKRAWKSSNDEEKHRRMAEVLVKKEVPLDWIDSIIVWNEDIKKYVEKIYKDNNIQLPKITYQPFNGRYFYYTKFFFDERQNETLVTGPYFLKNKFDNLIKKIIEKRKTNLLNPKFQNIQDAIQKIEINFCCIDELAGIYKLETVNEVHSENVSDHTLNIVKNLSTDSDDYYKNLSIEDKNIVKLSAYLHDIGKGPKSKWEDGKQKAYADHPADAIPMIERILSEDIAELTEYEIQKICLLVVYHDLIGDIVGKGRSKKELFDIIQDENELNMLIAISLADVLAIKPDWYIDITLSLDNLKEEVLEELSK